LRGTVRARCFTRVPVALDVALQLRQRYVIRIEGEQTKVFEGAGEHLRHPLVVILGDGNDRDQVQVEAVLPVECRTLTRQTDETLALAARRDHEDVHVGGRARQAVEDRHDEAAETVQFDLLQRARVYLREE